MFTGQILALDSSGVKTQPMFSSHGGCLTNAIQNGNSDIYIFCPPLRVAFATVRSKAVILLLFIHCLLLLPYGLGICVVLGIKSSLSIFLLWKRELV